ncbi:MAG: type II toxin-antitoxin system VapC family toxin [Desulfovibrionaceae bacterium]|jgi:predicted nucleic acid-binding protein|nr:type II toxin-antitoxin system VapC family toxin [Desulfovibrionaceae bacterium]
MSQGFLLDTNVLSELMRPTAAPDVLTWFASRAISAVYTSSITQAEVLTGIALLPAGQRRDALARVAQAMFAEDFAGQILNFDSAAAEHYALIVASRSALGRPISTEDAQIAAIALAANMTLVTRNSKDFVAINGLSQVNPWQLH